MAKLTFFYDLSSPWTYLAFNNIQSIIEETQARVVWRPFLVGGVFNAVNQGVYAARSNPTDPKVIHTFTWLHEWAALADLPLKFPTEHHPIKSVLAMRACCALESEQDTLYAFSHAVFKAYFTHGRNIDDPSVVADVANTLGIDGERLVDRAGEQVIKDRLRANTQEAITKGAFGSPTMIVNEDRLYFGNDQLPLVRQALL
ncbi:MAG: 2-hydroxychromene-2-carboxylate isomerase [Halieaceae bacterium]|nr:2-hydroxychromene-2-carboxylate isomerase [Halieaceae bacterium]MBT5134033.1 2-hydroxychromene-2-carboxylate isomerase [Halieaceae bacterium]MBT5557410.1 2-hydroxychromene-2-carboxylate isomerase [Halieaceae bacterium]MBT6180398.1 2-hydroxychromene-2-carboxylate isomerase [Halieaceae bacterium]MDG1799823.1 2-hydroxychromene-2-carboxylate isomerase [Luminiphilus sp.]